MPWELTILNYDGDPPRLRRDADVDRWLPMGALDDVRAMISESIPGIEWQVEPALLDLMKASGNDV